VPAGAAVVGAAEPAGLELAASGALPKENPEPKRLAGPTADGLEPNRFPAAAFDAPEVGVFDPNRPPVVFEVEEKENVGFFESMVMASLARIENDIQVVGKRIQRWGRAFL
jgi:hypothetical protein